jgi:Leucine-rich repeat (LRR) protein
MSAETQTYLDSLPNDIIRIDLSNRNLAELPDLSRFINLQYLECADNHLIILPKLHETLIELHCDKNILTSIPELNQSLKLLYCSDNYLTKLPDFNEKIVEVYCQNNMLTIFPELRPEFHKDLLHVEYKNNPIYNDPIGRNQFDTIIEQIHQNYLDTYDEKYGIN